MAEPRLPEKRAVRRSFERASRTYDEAAVLQAEVGRRLLQHLEPMTLAPGRIVDLGCGTGHFFAPLRRRFRDARVVGVDLAHAMLLRAARRTPAWKRLLGSAGEDLVCGDAENLPLASASAELVFSNLALQWCDPAAVFREAARVLAGGGLLAFSTFGPDTLKELRAAYAGIDAHEHVNSFVDMHDLGDALVQAGFADPVMDMEYITLEYAGVRALMRDLQAIGARNSLPGRRRGLSGRAVLARVEAAYEAHRRAGVLPATYEVVYGHAWKAAPRRLADGRQVIDFAPRARR